ncbi:MAG: Amidohydrolase [candidate division BRC1 bacterium ADurb.BinA292]|nr:MAG: Amidohydrolase [candidate division BRC1 bacterium ADurb.BinA292]
MSTTYSRREADQLYFEQHFEDWLPRRLFDLHAHLVPPGTLRAPSPERLARYWMLRLPLQQTVQEFFEDYAALLPGRQVHALAFGMPVQESDIARQNAMLLEGSRQHERLNVLFLTRPEDEEERLEQALADGFLGFKPYPDFVVGDHPGEEAIAEFLTPAMCRVAQRHRALVMLHISRPGRFGDARNVDDLLQLAADYPAMRLIIAHLGRAYNPIYLERALERLDGRHPWWYDFSAVVHPGTHRLALQSIPHERICFGFDNPIMLARGYYEFPTESTYRVRMHGIDLDEADYPPLAYQILKGFKEAAESVRLDRASLERILFQNAWDLVHGARADAARGAVGAAATGG